MEVNTMVFGKKKAVAGDKQLKVQVVAAGRSPVEGEGDSDWSVEDALIAAGIDADKVTLDGKEAKLSDKIGDAKKIVAIPNVKGG